MIGDERDESPIIFLDGAQPVMSDLGSWIVTYRQTSVCCPLEVEQQYGMRHPDVMLVEGKESLVWPRACAFIRRTTHLWFIGSAPIGRLHHNC